MPMRTGGYYDNYGRFRRRPSTAPAATQPLECSHCGSVIARGDTCDACIDLEDKYRAACERLGHGGTTDDVRRAREAYHARAR